MPEIDMDTPVMTIESLLSRQRPRRNVQGIAAALLPFEADGKIAVESFQNHLRATHRAGLMNAVNMDTGYVNYLSDAEKRRSEERRVGEGCRERELRGGGERR